MGDQIFLKADTIYTIPRPQEPGQRMLGHDVDVSGMGLMTWLVPSHTVDGNQKSGVPSGW